MKSWSDKRNSMDVPLDNNNIIRDYGELYLNIVRPCGELYAINFSTALSLRSKNIIILLNNNIVRPYRELHRKTISDTLEEYYHIIKQQYPSTLWRTLRK